MDIVLHLNNIAYFNVCYACKHAKNPECPSAVWYKRYSIPEDLGVCYFQRTKFTSGKYNS
jgi:hypothetical protein